MPRKTNFTTNAKGKDGKEYKNSYFRTTAMVGKDAEGKPIRKQFYGISKKEALAKRDEYLAGIKQGLSADYDKALFRSKFDDWFENVLRPSVALSSYKRYETDYRLRIKEC